MLYQMRTITLVILVTLSCGCSQYRIDKDLVDRIKTKEDWHKFGPEISYLAQRGSDNDVVALSRLIPMAMKGECSCCIGNPGDPAAIVLERLLEIDPKLSLFDSLCPNDRKEIYRYYLSINVLDWIDLQDEIKSKYQIEF